MITIEDVMVRVRSLIQRAGEVMRRSEDASEALKRCGRERHHYAGAFRGDVEGSKIHVRQGYVYAGVRGHWNWTVTSGSADTFWDVKATPDAVGDYLLCMRIKVHLEGEGASPKGGEFDPPTLDEQPYLESIPLASYTTLQGADFVRVIIGKYTVAESIVPGEVTVGTWQQRQMSDIYVPVWVDEESGTDLYRCSWFIDDDGNQT